MADIAFLLLVFFLVTTTFSNENIQDERLPRKTEDPGLKLKEWNILQVLANKNDDILVEEEEVETSEEIAEMVIKFYKHPSNEDNVKWPEVKTVTTQMAKTKIASYEPYALNLDGSLDEYTSGLYEDSLRTWQKKFDAAELLGGSYKEISEKAVIGITLDNSTKYETYIKVLDGILTGLAQLRNELCQEKFGRSFDELSDEIPEEDAMIDAIQLVYPKRIFKAKGIASAN